MKKLYITLFLFIFTVLGYSQPVIFNSGEPGIKATILQSRSSSVVIEYDFYGYYQQDIKIDGKNCVGLTAPDMINLMEKDMPQLITYRKSIIIPDAAGMNYRIISDETEEISTKTIMPSKGHMTRNINPADIPYKFGKFYRTDGWYPEQTVTLDEPYIVKNIRGMTIQINPVQYNPSNDVLRIHKKIVIEVFADANVTAVNPFVRLYPLTKVSSEFSPIYGDLFMNYGLDYNRYDSIAEPGRMLVIYASQYASTITQFVNWKIQRGMTVLTAEYPAATGSGAAAIKTYIQNLYNAPEKITYIVLVGEAAEIPYLSGLYEGAASDPCYVKLAGTDAYPDAFISRMSPTSASNLSYIITKIIKYERDIILGASWYKMGTGIASDQNGGTPYYDWERMNFLRDTLMSHRWTQVDQIYDPGALSSTVITSVNAGKSVVNYIGHGSGTSWSTTGFNVSNVYSLTNGWKNPFILDVSCLNGQFTLGECFAEAWLRAGDTTNPRGAIAMYSASTNASWVPPCDMQSHSVYLFVNKKRTTVGGICFAGVMKGMDLWGGSTGEGLKLMEQYHIFGDCSTLLTFGVPLGPSIVHTPLSNTENLAGPYTVNCIIYPLNSPIDPGKTRLFWTRGSAFTDSLLLTNTSGNNWTGNIPGNGVQNTYKYYIKTVDMMNRIVTNPFGAPVSYHSFQAAPDLVKPVIVHSSIQDIPKNQWPATVTANVTDNIGIDSVWVRWYINTPSRTIKHFRLINTSGSIFAAAFNSTQSEVNYNDSIFYRVFARDNSANHNTDSTSLYKFKLLAVANACIGTGTTSVAYPFNTYWHDSRTQMLWTKNEILTGGGAQGIITKIGFNVVSAASQVMNGFSIKMQHTSATSVTGFVSSSWTTVYSGTYTVPGTGWQFVNLQTPFQWDGNQNLLIEICFDNTSYTAATNVNATSTAGMTWEYHTDNSTGCTMTGGTAQANRPNICMEINLMVGNTTSTQQIPTVFSLSQNYPNPFNPVTQINYSVPKTSMVKMVIYDVIGREVITLVNDVKVPGNYSVPFDASNLASGVYFYKMVSGDFTDVKKMVVLK